MYCCYRVYGLTVTSELLFPELPRLPGAENVVPGNMDVRIRGGHSSYQPEEWYTVRTFITGEPWLQKATVPGGYLLRFPTLADFAVTADGGQVDYRSAAGTPEGTLRHLLLDHVLPLSLGLRGIEALHATAVQTPTGVCVFTGPSGVGKSTLAAYLARRGMTVLCDDCLVLQERHEELLAVPAYPGVRLWDDVLALVRQRPSTLTPVAHYTKKQRLLYGSGRDVFPMEAQPITRIYALVRRPPVRGRRDECPPRIELLSPRDACVELLPQLYRFDSVDRVTVVRQLAFLDRLVSRVQVRRLYCPDRLSALAEVSRTLCADL
jgi:hypothetical protein